MKTLATIFLQIFVLFFYVAPFTLTLADTNKNMETLRKNYKEAKASLWKEVFNDSCTQDWKKNWVLDGKKAKISHSEKGMDFSAGPTFRDDSCHAVMWTKPLFRGDLKIEYEYTKLDQTTRAVNILYIQATGSGKEQYDSDIFKWNSLREVPAMRMYFNHMNTYHISYAAFGLKNPDPENDYIRARRYMPETGKGLKGTELTPDYERTGLFQPGVVHQITVLKKGDDLFMHILSEGEKERKEKELLCHWKTNSFPSITEGRIGLRHMYTRSSRYRNFRVSIGNQK